MSAAYFLRNKMAVWNDPVTGILQTVASENKYRSKYSRKDVNEPMKLFLENFF